MIVVADGPPQRPLHQEHREASLIEVGRVTRVTPIVASSWRRSPAIRDALRVARRGSALARLAVAAPACWHSRAVCDLPPVSLARRSRCVASRRSRYLLSRRRPTSTSPSERRCRSCSSASRSSPGRPARSPWATARSWGSAPSPWRSGRTTTRRPRSSSRSRSPWRRRLVGLLLGLPATRLRGPYLAGMTLAFAVAFAFILSSFSSWTGGDCGLQCPPQARRRTGSIELFGTRHNPPHDDARSGRPTSRSSSRASRSSSWPTSSRAAPAGRCDSVRDNDVAAELVGVSLPRARVVAFMVSSAYAALGGALLTLIEGSVSPSTYSFALSITILSVDRHRRHRDDLRGAHRRDHLRVLHQRDLVDHESHRPQPPGQPGEPTQRHHLRGPLDRDDALRTVGVRRNGSSHLASTGARIRPVN